MIVQTPALIVMLYESPNSPHRTVFTDGRDLPKDPNPAWLGYSVGRWEGDTLVVTTAGFNDHGWLDSAGHPQTECPSHHRTPAPPRLRPHGFRDHDRRSESVHPPVHHQDGAAARGGYRTAGGRLRERARRRPPLGRHRDQVEPGAARTYAGVYEFRARGARSSSRSPATCCSCRGSTSRSFRCSCNQRRNSCRLRRRAASNSSRTRRARSRT